MKIRYLSIGDDRDPSGVITLTRKRKGRCNHSDWLLSLRGTISSYIAQDNDNLQALEAYEGRLIPERETAEGTSTSGTSLGVWRQRTILRSLGLPARTGSR